MVLCMSTDSLVSDLPLAEALVAWSDPALVDAVRTRERQFTPYEMAGFLGARLCADAELTTPSSTRWMMGPPDHTLLYAAWDALERDFRRRMTQGEFYLSGVQTEPELTIAPRPVPGAWAADCRFNYEKDVVEVHTLHFCAVQASRQPPDPALYSLGTGEVSTGSCNAQPMGNRLTADQVVHLDPDVVVALLEQHAEHVRTGLRVNLAPPGKASVIALAATMMERRARDGLLRSTMMQEATWLAGWLAQVAPSYDAPGEKTLQNKLGGLHKELKAKYPAATEGNGQTEDS
jgi:hypothetical protein